ncbi:MAG: hemolysin III family protein [Rhizobiaceae bacterium]|nr:hemolysin III family protein [Rhizobiaceae bacterium]
MAGVVRNVGAGAIVPGAVNWPYSPGELVADALVHGLGVFLALGGAAAFLVTMAGRIEATDLAAAGVYLVTLVISIAASAAYNVWPVSRTKWVLRRFDHSAIYLLIAGTYTPFMVRMETFAMLAAMWSVSLFGVALKLFRPGQFDRLSILLYLALGWSGVATYERLSLLPPLAVWLIVVGGVVYSLGVVFHLLEHLRYQNVIWHGFVLVAAGIHFVAMWASMQPTA